MILLFGCKPFPLSFTTLLTLTFLMNMFRKDMQLMKFRISIYKHTLLIRVSVWRPTLIIYC